MTVSARTAPSQQAFTSGDLPIYEDGRIYHLALKPEELAPNILIVGDPERVPSLAKNFLEKIEVDRQHRGLHSITGYARNTGQRVSLITSGMGTSSLEVVLQELVALVEIDFQTRTRKEKFPKINIIRVGTSGALQKSTEIGTVIITSYAIGLDNTGLFYDAKSVDDTSARLENELSQAINQNIPKNARFLGKIHPYISKADAKLQKLLFESAVQLGLPVKVGMTASGSGFFGNQGRETARIPLSVPDIDLILSEFDPKLSGQRIENMEMESSFLLHFMGGLGHAAASICPAIANRREDTFFMDYEKSVLLSAESALIALSKIGQNKHLPLVYNEISI